MYILNLILIHVLMVIYTFGSGYYKALISPLTLVYIYTKMPSFLYKHATIKISFICQFIHVQTNIHL